MPTSHLVDAEDLLQHARRRLLLAVVAQAIIDARRGDVFASRWLDEYAAALEVWLGWPMDDDAPSLCDWRRAKRLSARAWG